MKDDESQLDYHQNPDDVAQHYAGLSFMLHSEKKQVFCHLKNIHTHRVGMLFFYIFTGSISH
jgi:hypothetical protein